MWITVFMLIALKPLFQSQQVWGKKPTLILCVYSFASVGFHGETNVYLFPDSFNKSNISYAKIMYMLSKQCRYQNTFDFSKHQWSVFRHYLLPAENIATSDLNFSLYSYINQATWIQYKHEKTSFFYRSKRMGLSLSAIVPSDNLKKISQLLL